MRGFSLIEIMLVLVIVSVLAAMSVPVYSHYFVRAHRIAAETNLLKVAAALEQYYLQNNSYKDATLVKLGFADLAELHIVSATESEFALQANVAGDSACGVLTLNSLGEKSLPECWS